MICAFIEIGWFVTSVTLACNERSSYVPLPIFAGCLIRASTYTAPYKKGAAVGAGVVAITTGVADAAGVTVSVGAADAAGVAVSVGAGVGVPACFPTHPENKIASPMTVMRIIDFLNCAIPTSNTFIHVLEDKGIDFISG